MKRLISHSCGHETTVNIVGPGATRDDRAAWLATQPCPDCARQARQAARQAANARSAERTHAEGWPALTGTPGQTAWAGTIRADAIDAMCERLRGALPADTADQAVALWTAAALRETRAGWWIDHRDVAVRAVNSYLLTADELATLTTITSTGGPA